MWFLRTWLAILALTVGAAVLLAFVAVKPGERDALVQQQLNLDYVQLSADLLLKVEAQQWMDAAAKISKDRRIVETLEQVAKRSLAARPAQAKLHGRMLTLRDQLRGKPLMIVVDAGGKQVERVGVGEENFKPGEDGLAGYPLVEAALRGLRRDDTWMVDGKLYLVAASPVVSRSTTSYVGAIILGQEVNDAFATHVRDLIGKTASIDLAFFLRGKLVGSTSASKVLEPLPSRYSREKEQIAEKLRSPVFSIPEDGETVHRAIMAPLPGQAGKQDAFYAVLFPPPAAGGLEVALNQLSPQDFAAGGLPWVLIAGVTLGVLVLSLLVVAIAWGRPSKHFVDDLQALIDGQLASVDEMRYGGRWHTLARLTNEALDRAGRRAAISGDRNLSAVLGNTQGMYTTPGLRPAPDVNLASGVDVDRQAEAPTAPRVPNRPTPPPPPPTSGDGDGGIRELGALELEEAATEFDDQGRRFATNPKLPLLSPVDLPPELRRAEEDAPTELAPASDPSARMTAPLLAPEDETFDERRSNTARDLQTISKGAIPASGLQEDTVTATEFQPEGEYRSVFDEFVRTKQNCGENTDSLTYEKFVAKLDKNRSTLMERFGCQSVRFQVYVKEGKAAIKATPIN